MGNSANSDSSSHLSPTGVPSDEDENAGTDIRTRVESHSNPTGGPFRVGEKIADRFDIIEQLGRGGFGFVYRAMDLKLNRPVAVKRSNGLRSFVAGRISGEAKAIASLNHPNIIAIYDLISIGGGELLIVMECPDGMTLAQRLAQQPLKIGEAVDIACQVASALQHAHSRQLVHSDLKPRNLFLGSDGRVRLLDFGLAVACFPETTRGQSTGGTTGYMSPEQIRGESHLIDGRADIWALGVVMYQMLTGAKPFLASNESGVHRASLQSDPPPIRQLRPQVDPELQRIVSRCLEKRRIDRYESASDLLSDLRAWQSVQGVESTSEFSIGPVQDPSDSSTNTPHFRSLGLQPFTEQDADSYLSLVPGSRDRTGMPLSIRFWKQWCESDDPNLDFPVGVLYGPSGAGKTSFVRAGLIRKLDPTVCCVYVECRSGDLGGRITRIIQSRIHEESTGSSLRELLTRIRTGSSESRGFRKLLIILDQFEAWAQQSSLEERHDFADALRQCDGSQIRALVVTRDDYWMGVTELLRWLELPLQEGRNIASVDLIDPPHAQRLLEALGRASGALPDETARLTSAQQQFIKQAVDELTVNGSVIAVHLVIFAQMAALRDWTPRNLRSSGGVSGACSLYLQELFDPNRAARTHSPEYRRVAPAVIPILSELLPEDDAAAVDNARTRSELLESVQKSGCEHLFDDCLRVLCEDLRLVTVVDDGSRSDPSDSTSSDPTYRLSHDFLVEPIREWIDRARKRTWRGRKLARLSEVAGAWQRRPGQTQMPGFFEYCSIVAATRLGGRTKTETEFMRAATRHHSGRISVAVVALVGFIGMTAYAIYKTGEARAVTAELETAKEQYINSEVRSLFSGEPEFLPEHIENLGEYSEVALEKVRPWAESANPQLQMRAKLFLLAQGEGSISDFVPTIEEIPAQLFPETLQYIDMTDGGAELLEQTLPDELSERQSNRIAILLHYLGRSDQIESMLEGSDDFVRDGNLLVECATWRSTPDPWIALLERSSDPQVTYHTSIVLSTFPRDELASVQDRIDTTALANSPSGVVHSAGRFLASHLGKNPYDIPLQPPADADWRVWVDDIPFIRVDAGDYRFAGVAYSRHVEPLVIERPFWMATIPVSRRLYDEFVADVETLPDGSELLDDEISLTLPEELATDVTEPVRGISHFDAMAFCNWLSRREGLEPVYEFLTERPFVEPDEIEELIRRPTMLTLEAPWKINEDANGYRLPSVAMYAVALKCNYKYGLPWFHTTTLAELGGDFTPPQGVTYPRPLFSLMPNRFGFYINDLESGGWVFTRSAAAIKPGIDRAFLGVYRQTLPMDDNALILARTSSTTP